jgi:hypothetical protein
MPKSPRPLPAKGASARRSADVTELVQTGPLRVFITILRDGE